MNHRRLIGELMKNQYTMPMHMEQLQLSGGRYIKTGIKDPKKIKIIKI